MYVLLISIVLYCVSFAMLFGQGIWNNILTLINVILAALLATSLFEPVANWLDSIQPTLTYFWDFTALWGLFAIFYIVLRTATDLLSPTRVRYKSIVDLIGGIVLATWISWVLVCFSAMTLHTAPLSRDFYFGSFRPGPDAQEFYGNSPDVQWLGFTQRMSTGSFSTSPPEGVEGELGAHIFDPEGNFVFDYGERRARLELAPELRVYREK